MATDDLESRVGKLEQAIATFSADLRFALLYIRSDAASSLTKSRVVLEKLLLRIYTTEMGREPRKALLGEMLVDNQFTRRIERRILSRMNAIRDLANLGPHGECVEPSDAAKILDDLCEVLDWYLRRYGSPEVVAVEGGSAARADLPAAAGRPAGLTAEEADRLEAVSRLLVEFSRPVHVRLQRDNINWRRILDLREPDGSLRRRIAESIERDYILPNHDEIVALIERCRHLVASDAELCGVLDAYLHHVVVYKAIRAAGDAMTLPIRAGAPWPNELVPLVERRIQALEREHNELSRKQRR